MCGCKVRTGSRAAGLSFSLSLNPPLPGMPWVTWAPGGLFQTLLNRGRGKSHKWSAKRPSTPQYVHLLSLPEGELSLLLPEGSLTLPGTHTHCSKHTACITGAPNPLSEHCSIASKALFSLGLDSLPPAWGPEPGPSFPVTHPHPSSSALILGRRGLGSPCPTLRLPSPLGEGGGPVLCTTPGVLLPA